jgi:Domain of unknown function (DUF4266)
MTPLAKRLVLLILWAVVATMSTGCAAMAVRPWDRDLMAEKAMTFDPIPREAAIDDHIYFSKEGSMGGTGVGGGGCGCN